MQKICVIGIGRLGLCFALQLERAGYDVLGIDTRRNYVESINRRSLRSPEPGVEEALRSCSLFWATQQLQELQNFPASLIYVAVATPTVARGGYDHSGVNQVLASLYALNLTGSRQDVVIISTTLPGYCDMQAADAAKHGYFLSYKPEFVAQGSIMHDLQYPDQVLLGAADDIAARKLADVYKKVTLSRPTVVRMSRLSAEIAKLATNCFLTTKISFANTIGDLCVRTGAETDKVLAVIGADTRIGSKFLRYGFGYGGPCFPRDNRALAQFAESQQIPLFLSKATDQANQQHLEFQVSEYLLKHDPQEPIHLTSVTYKPGTVILEESQQLALAERLAHAGRTVVIHESDAVLEQLKQIYGNLFEYRPMDRTMAKPAARKSRQNGFGYTSRRVSSPSRSFRNPQL
jgi:UDPglucose 6-dehydrogenase